MCGRVYVNPPWPTWCRISPCDPAEVGALGNTLPRYNGATQDYPIIIVDEPHKAPRCSSRPLGFRQKTGGLVINARSELATNGLSSGHISSAGH
jgi:hypothetical protein